MCYNCGCKRKNDEMGHDDNITLKTLAKAAIAMDMNGTDTLQNIKELLNETTAEELDAKIEEVKNHEHEDHDHDHDEDHDHHED